MEFLHEYCQEKSETFRELETNYTSCNKVRGVYWNHHVRPSVRLSVVRIWVSGA